MASIRDYTVTEFTTSTATWTPDEMPTHESGDLLIALLAKDSISGFSTSSGWTSYIAQSTAGAHIACQAKRATSSSETFSVTLTSETGILIILVIKDVYGSTLADAWDLSPVVDSADKTTNPFAGISGQSTTYDNALIIRAFGGDGGQSPTAYPPNVNLYNGDAGQGSLGLAYIFQITAGSITQGQWYCRLDAEDGREMLMAIRPSATVTKPAYSDPTVSLATFLRSLGWATTNPPFADTWSASITMLAIGTQASQVWVYTGSYVDETTDFSSPATGDVPLGTAVGNILYIGGDSTFNEIGMALSTLGVGGTIIWEYYNGGSWATLTSIAKSGQNLKATPVHIYFNPPTNWAQVDVNGVTKYYIRARTSVAFTTGPIISQGVINGVACIYDVGAALADAGTNPYADALNLTLAKNRSALLGCDLQFASALDMDTGIIIVCQRPTQHRDGAIDPATFKINGGGICLTFQDSSDNYLSYIIFTRDAIDVDKSGPNTVAIDWNGSATAWASRGSVNKSAVTKLLFRGRGYYGAIACSISMLCLVSKLCLAGGSSSNLLSFDDMDLVFNHCVGILPIFKRVGSQATIYAPLQIGGGDPVNISIDLKTFAFPHKFSSIDKYCIWNVAEDIAGIKFYPKSGDTLKFTNCLFTSDSSYRWEFDPSSSTSGVTMDFSGTTIIKAKVTLKNVGIFASMIFRNCKQIDASACTLSKCKMSGAPSTGSGLTVDASSLIQECEIDTTSVDAGNSFMATATPEDISDCIFNGASDKGHAIKITTIGTYSFDGNKFNNYGADGTTSAAIFNDSGGLVTLNITGGGDTPTVRNGAGASTTINNMVSLWVKVTDSSGNPIENAQTAIFLADSPYTELMNEDTNAQGIAQQDYNYISDKNVIVRVRKSTSGTTRYISVSQSATITSDGLTMYITLQKDIIVQT